MTEQSASERLKKYLKGRNWEIQTLTPDASAREYFRLSGGKQNLIACVYPQNEFGINQLKACLEVTELFLNGKLPVAEIAEVDENLGIVVHQDFGDTILRNVLLETDEESRENLINQAIELIIRIQALTEKATESGSIAGKLKFDEEKLTWELNFFKTHYFESLLQKPLSETENNDLQREFVELSQILERKAKVVCHRDFHAANLMLQNGELKIIDHQDARMGSVAYDIVSLLLDRVTEKPNPVVIENHSIYFLRKREKLGLDVVSFENFQYEFDLMTIQRCLKAIGTFSFQKAMRGKTGYSQYIKPMFQIVLDACQSLGKFAALQEKIKEQLKAEN